MENSEQKSDVAFNLCLKIKAIQECPFHEGAYIDCLESLDYKHLYQYVIDEMPDAINVFDDANDLKNSISEVLADIGTECPYCVKNEME